MHVNLIPPARRAKIIERRRRALWVRILRGYTILLVAACAAAYFPANAAAPLIEASLERVNRRIEQAQKTLDEVKGETDKLEARIAAAKAVGEHPDWSMLMDALSRARNGQVVLDSFDLAVSKVDDKAPAGGASAPPAAGAIGGADASKPKGRDSVVVKVSGYCVSPGSAFEFARRIQAMGLFDRVDVKDTRAQKLGEANAVHFEMEMQLVCGQLAAAQGEAKP